MAYIRSCKRKYNTRSHSRKDKPLNEQTMSEKLQIGLGRYVHDVQYSQTYDELDSERNVCFRIIHHKSENTAHHTRIFLIQFEAFLTWFVH